jgi:hypothetical protein
MSEAFCRALDGINDMGGHQLGGHQLAWPQIGEPHRQRKELVLLLWRCAGAKNIP